MSIHRFIPATEKHGPKTACGIKLKRGKDGYRAWDGYKIETTDKGQTLDCPRCLRVLKLRHDNSDFNL